MASYVGTYVNDVGVHYRQVKMVVYFYSEGIRLPTTYRTDDEILPQIFKDNTRRYRKDIATCSIDYSIIRVAQCYVADDAYYQIPCPFIGGTNEFRLFFQQLVDSNKFRLVNLRGENLPYSMLWQILRNS